MISFNKRNVILGFSKLKIILFNELINNCNLEGDGVGSNAGSPKFVAVPQMTDNIGTPPQVFKSLMIDFIKLKFSWFDKFSWSNLI